MSDSLLGMMEHNFILQKPNLFALRIGPVRRTWRRMAGRRRMLQGDLCLYRDGHSVSSCSPGTLLPLCIIYFFSHS